MLELSKVHKVEDRVVDSKGDNKVRKEDNMDHKVHMEDKDHKVRMEDNKVRKEDIPHMVDMVHREDMLEVHQGGKMVI